MSENKVSGMMKEVLESIRSVADSNTVIGEPVKVANGTMIIPVSKVSIGFASGGLDYAPSKKTDDGSTKTKTPAVSAAPYFGGGGGTGVSVIPLGFLVVDKEGRVDLLNLTNPAAVPPVVGAIDSVASFADGLPDLINRLKNTFAKDKTVDGLDDDVLKEKINEEKEKAEKD